MMINKITPISETDERSVSPEIDANTTLDDLFDQLKDEVQVWKRDNDTVNDKTQFENIKESVKQLPKLSSLLDGKEFSVNKHASSQVIYDPIVVKSKKNEEPTDAGKNWFNMPKPEVTKEIKNDLLILSKRDVLDPKRHYKKQKWVQPKFFQIGEIVNDNYSKNMTRKQKGTSMINELLVDDDTKKYFKRRYTEIQEQKMSGNKRDYKKLLKMRRKF